MYLNEAKHNYKLKVFKVRIVKDNGENGAVMFYGSVQVEMKGAFNLELSDNGMVYAFNAGSNNGNSSVFVVVINIYGENSTNKVNGIEKYLLDETKERFQIFVGNAKGDLDAKVRESKEKDYFKRFIVYLLDFDNREEINIATFVDIN